jgi:hypothetical protein
VLYVEGARDREILATWARRIQPDVVRAIEQSAVILGGRQPARALRDFERRGGAAEGWRGLIVLDRDDHDPSPAPAPAPTATFATDVQPAPSGLETFVWSLRHIESYLLVPAAIRRVLGDAEDDPRVESALAEARFLETGVSTATAEDPHAKRLLGPGGVLSERLGQTLAAGTIAGVMRREDLHPDVHALLARIGELAGVTPRPPEVVVRRPSD